MKTELKFGILVLSIGFLLSGCVVRTYPVLRDRIDQDLTTGNRGYLQGTLPATEEPRERKATRTTQVVEVEVGPVIKFEKASKPQPAGAGVSRASEEAGETTAEGNRGYLMQSTTPDIAGPQTTGAMEKYTVEKNDTLQKISQKFYGTTRKWKKIYNANQDTLKAPNKIRPGQVINIPVEGLKEPKENLK